MTPFSISINQPIFTHTGCCHFYRKETQEQLTQKLLFFFFLVIHVGIFGLTEVKNGDVSLNKPYHLGFAK